MSGGILNLKSEGVMSALITGNPTKTYFKSVYSKHTNFGLQKFRIDYNGLRTLRTTTESSFTFKIPRYADLLMDTYLVVTLPDIYSPILPPQPLNSANPSPTNWAPYEFRWIDYLGAAMISEILITCGSQTIQRYPGDYIISMVERDFSAERKELFYSMIGHIPELNDPANAMGRVNMYPSAYYTSNSVGAEPSIRGRTLYVPLNTLFSKDSRCAFPLVALQYNELQIRVTLRPIQELFRIRDVLDTTLQYPYVQPDMSQEWYQMYRFLQTPPSIVLTDYGNQVNDWNADVHLLATYCFLSNDEARLFAADTHNYLFKDVVVYNFHNLMGTTKVQLQSSAGLVSSWMWYFQRNDVKQRNEWTNYTNWPYNQLPMDVSQPPEPTIENLHTPLYNIPSLTYNQQPFVNRTNTGIQITGVRNEDNVREILQTMGILLNGQYREQALENGVFNYVEKYAHSKAFAPPGWYCYNFCLDTDPSNYQPSGALNNNLFRMIEWEITTHVPPVNPDLSLFQVICDEQGNAIGVNNPGQGNLYEYTYNLTIFEERYNVLTITGGNCGLMYAR